MEDRASLVARRLVDRIVAEGRVVAGGFLKVDAFLNHRLEPGLTMDLGTAFADRFDAAGVDRVDVVLTAESSGIAPALATAVAMRVPMVYARKRRPATMVGPVLETHAPSRTKGGTTPLIVSPEALPAGSNVVIVDDFLATGHTTAALADLVARGGARLVGIGCVIEKTFQDGRALLDRFGVPIECLAAIDAIDARAGTLTVRVG